MANVKIKNVTDGRVDGHTDGRSDERTDGRTNGRTDRRMDGLADERTDGVCLCGQHSADTAITYVGVKTNAVQVALNSQTTLLG